MLKSLLRRLKEPAVLQRYINTPMLLPGGLKFDLRIYALVLRVQPRAFFICRDGLVRVCSAKYHEQLDEINAHLTNYSLNKKEDSFEHSVDASDGSIIIASVDAKCRQQHSK